MAMNFPAAPSVGQIYTSGGASFIWDGVKWKSLGVNVLARDQNLADLADKSAARYNLGVWETIQDTIIGTATSWCDFTLPAGYKVFRLTCGLLLTAMSVDIAAYARRNGAWISGTNLYRYSLWRANNGAMDNITAIQAPNAYIGTYGDAPIPTVTEILIHPGYGGVTYPVINAKGTSYNSGGSLNSYMWSNYVDSTGQLDGIRIQPIGAVSLNVGSFLRMEGLR